MADLPAAVVNTAVEPGIMDDAGNLHDPGTLDEPDDILPEMKPWENEVWAVVETFFIKMPA